MYACAPRGKVQGPALQSFAPGGVQGQLSHYYDLRTSSPTCLRCWFEGGFFDICFREVEAHVHTKPCNIHIR